MEYFPRNLLYFLCVLSLAAGVPPETALVSWCRAVSPPAALFEACNKW
jgi:hypothetical protein